MSDFFAFRTMISATVIQVVFVLGLIGIVIGAISAIASDQAVFGILVLVFGTLYWRIICEFIIVVFRMNSSLAAIQANTDALAPTRPGPPAASQPPAVGTATSEELEARRSAAPETSAEVLPQAGWYDDPERPGHKRWWDGSAWGMRDDEHSTG